jgi:hypothetical protein
VSNVLNMISNFETATTASAVNLTAAKPRPQFGLDACLHALAMGTAPASTCAVAFARPRTPLVQAAADAVWQHQALAAVGQAAAQQLSSEKFMYTTRITVSGGGAPGSHPAREPV